MNDRKSDLDNIANSNGLKYKQIVDVHENNPNENIKQFTIKVNLAHKYIKEINLNVDILIELKKDINTVIDTQEKELNTKIENTNNNISVLQKKALELLQDMKDSVEQLGEDKSLLSNENPTEIRIKKNLYGTLINTYNESLTKNQKVNDEIKKSIQKKIIRNAEIVLNKNLDENEKIEYLQNPEKVQEQMKNALLGKAPLKLQNAYNDIEERSKDLQKLESNMKQVTKLFQDLAALVKLQGELIDNIEMNIKTAKNAVIEGEKNIIQAKKNMQSARKKKCCILLIVLVILVVILAPVLSKTLGSA